VEENHAVAKTMKIKTMRHNSSRATAIVDAGWHLIRARAMGSHREDGLGRRRSGR
jgi:hypothetical protein